MITALTLIAASLATLDDLAKIVATDTIPRDSDFCVTGTVSYISVYTRSTCHMLVEDGETGVDMWGTVNPNLRAGDRVRLGGSVVTLGPGNAQPNFWTIDILDHGDPPSVAEGSADEIMSGRHDFHRAYLVGEVRDAEPSGTDPCWNYLSLISGGRQYYAPIPAIGASFSQLESLIGSTVRLDGYPDPHNCSFRFLDERRFVVAGIDNIEVLSPPPKDLFATAPSVESLRKLAPETLPRLGRHKAVGTLVTAWQSRNAMIQLSDGRMVTVSFSSATDIPRGSNVEVIGYPSTDGFFLRLTRAIARRIPGGAPFKEPAVKDITDNITGKLSSDGITYTSFLQGQRVRIAGVIAGIGAGQHEHMTLPLSIAGRLMDVDFSSAPGAAEGLAPGCRVSVVATCVLTSENWADLSAGIHLSGIRLVVDKADDLTILSRPPWWTAGRLSAVVALLLVVLSAILFWNRQLRRLSEKRGRELYRERSASALAELKTAERTRLAADIHDSISQILTGAAMQLDAGETNAAKRIIASCRRELRTCLWDLRSHALDAENFADAVRETLAPHIDGIKVVIDMRIPSSGMSEALRHATLCIIREATSNAIRHGNAETVAISGELAGNVLSFTVVDDGKGFDPANCQGSEDGHFGLMGMRERAKAFNGAVTIGSAPGNGTEIAVTLEDKDTES